MQKSGVTATGNGTVDAAYRAIWRAIELEPKLIAFGINATSDHSDAMGEAMVTLRSGDIVAPGRGVSTDIVESAIKDGLGVAGFVAGTQVFDARLVEDVGADLVAPADVGFAVFYRLRAGAAFVEFQFVEFGAQLFHTGAAVFVLAAAVL